jgi:hypothetical protein
MLSNSIHTLDLAVGLKELLLDKGFITLDSLLKMPPADLASILGTDVYIARLIIMSAQRHAKIVEQ